MALLITTCFHYSSGSQHVSHNFISLSITESNLRRFNPASRSRAMLHQLGRIPAKWTYGYSGVWSSFLESNIYVTRYEFHEPFPRGLCCLWLGRPLSSQRCILLFSLCLFHCLSIPFFSSDDSLLDKSAKLSARLVSGA